MELLTEKQLEYIKYNYYIENSGLESATLRWASNNGHLEIVKLLLEDPRVDLSDINNKAIRYASSHGYLEIVKLLLKDPRVDPSDINNSAIRWASNYCYLEIVKLLLQDTRVIEKGNLEKVKNKYPFEYIYYKNLKNRNAKVIQKWYTRILYHPNSYYIRNYISKF